MRTPGPDGSRTHVDIRPERDADRDGIHAVHVAAFPTAAEARLVERIRGNGRAVVSLVAEQHSRIVGHVLFSPVVIDAAPRRQGLGLAPLAVAPAMQRRGIGSLLVAAGLDECRRRDIPFVVVLGHAAYYPRFGFAPAAPRGLANEFGATDTFFVLELRRGELPVDGGLIHYGPEFAEFLPDQ